MSNIPLEEKFAHLDKLVEAWKLLIESNSEAVAEILVCMSAMLSPNDRIKLCSFYAFKPNTQECLEEILSRTPVMPKEKLS